MSYIIRCACLDVFITLALAQASMNCFCETDLRGACESDNDDLFITNGSMVLVTNAQTGAVVSQLKFDDKDEKAEGSLAVDEDDLYVVTKAHGIYVYSLEGTFKRSFGGCDQASGIAVGLHSVYAADRENNRIIVFDKASGHFDRVIGNGCGIEAGSLCCPCGVALYKDTYLIVAEMGNGRIQVFNTQTDESMLVVDGYPNVFSVLVNEASGTVYASLYSTKQIRKFHIILANANVVFHVQSHYKQLDYHPLSLFLHHSGKLGIVSKARICFLDLF